MIYMTFGTTVVFVLRIHVFLFFNHPGGSGPGEIIIDFSVNWQPATNHKQLSKF
jgi:hypothetical protein